MSAELYQRVFLADYRPPPFFVENVYLSFELGEASTIVVSKAAFRRNPEYPDADAALELSGKDLELVGIALDETPLDASEYRLEGESLFIENVSDAFELEITTRLAPAENHTGLGMFMAGGVLATQCEAQGFRRMTWFPDRPDVLARYTVRLTADKKRFPVLLSNGNPVDRGELDDGRHWIVWEDPAPKPSYIFAVVAGQLESLEDRFVTRSGRDVALAIHTSAELVGECAFAMASLKRAMEWEEQVYGLECDVDVYNIVALEDWAGAMENKGLNIYDAAGIIAGPMVTTDNDYMVIERIIAHEYFHNWSGNRVTCRDWFQLSLKEGLTRFRDQEFTRDMSAPDIKRIETVMRLRRDQFAEDQGPNSHCVQPDSYLQIQNFYTPTVYDKGAELVRMIYTLLGAELYFEGIALYIKRHDGQAVTIEDFLRAMEDAGDRDLSQFRLWYHQAGTPVVEIATVYDEATQVFSITTRQSCAATPGQTDKQPFHIPLSVGLIAPDGREVAARVLEVTAVDQTFEFAGVSEKPLVSVLRDFSAPVELRAVYSDQDLALLTRFDTDAFARWEASQQLLLRSIHRLLEARGSGETDGDTDSEIVGVIAALLDDEATDKGLIAQLITLPDEPAVAVGLADIDMGAIDLARHHLKRSLGLQLQSRLLDTYRSLARNGEYRPDAQQIAERALRHVCLDYLANSGEPEHLALCVEHISAADNLSDALGGLSIISRIDCAERQQMIDGFYQRWCSDSLVLLKWFFVVGASPVPGAIDGVRQVMKQAYFDLLNPAHGMNLLGGFFRRNYVEFHNPTGSGYEFLADLLLEMDAFRPDAGAWLMPQMMQWRRHEPRRRNLMRAQLERMVGTEGISSGLYELVSNALARRDST
jgi:aminopeptidase N